MTYQNKLTVTVETFKKLMFGLIESGVTFEAEENGNGDITITFLGGY